MSDEAVITESSPVTEAPSIPQGADYQSWRLTGDLPEPKPAEPAPAETTEGDKPSDAKAPESQPGTPEGKPEAGDKAKTEKRFQELTRHNKELKAKLDAAEAKLNETPKEVAKPESTPAAKPDGKLAAPVRPIKPKQDAFATWEEYQAALDKHDEAKDQYYEDLADFKLKQAEEQRVSKDQGDKFAVVWDQRVAAALAKHPDLHEVMGDELPPHNDTAKGFILDSEIGPEIMRHLKINLDEALRIEKLNPYRTAAALRDIEASLQKPVAAGPKRVPAASKPPTEVGTNASAIDEVEEAGAAGDYARYKRLQNAKDIAAKRGS